MWVCAHVFVLHTGDRLSGSHMAGKQENQQASRQIEACVETQ